MRALIAGMMMACCCTAPAQTPPVKMGLWESTRITTPAGMAPMTVKAQVCITPETYEKSLGMIGAQQPGCKINTAKTAKGYTFEGSCTSPNGGSMELRGMESIDDTEHTSGSSHSTMTMSGRTMESDSKRSSRFISSDCGAVQPGKPVISR